MAAISEGEVAVYDRQLRLWGVQAQQRLLKAKVLIWGFEGSNVEACKNLVLAGGSLVICDHRAVETADVSFNYFLRAEDMGKNRAECAAKRVQEMNPLCAVSTANLSPEGAADAGVLREAVNGYDFTILSPGIVGWNVDQVCNVDAACREAGGGFALTVSCGEIAFFFSDLGNHTVQEYSSAQGGAGSTAASGTTAEPEAINFPSFKEWLACSPADLQKRKVDASFVMVALCLAFLRGRPGQARPELGDSFQEYCRGPAGCTPAVDGVGELSEAFRLLFVEPLMHVASIVGGLLAQEVIKAITKRDTPLVNCVCFNAHTGAALVERVPALPSAAKKRKVEETLDLDD